MKKVINILFFLILISGCEQTTETTPDIFVSFNIQGDFRNDSVKLVLDNRTLLDSTIRTDPLVGFAWNSFQKLSRDNHLLNFKMIEFGVQKDYQIQTFFDTSTVIIRFDRSTNKISISQIKGILIYG